MSVAFLFTTLSRAWTMNHVWPVLEVSVLACASSVMVEAVRTYEPFRPPPEVRSETRWVNPMSVRSHSARMPSRAASLRS